MTNYKFIYILLLVIIISILICINYNSMFPIIENYFGQGVTVAPAVDESQSVLANRATTKKIASTTYNSKLNDITTQINNCKSLIDEINSIIPRNIDNIKIGNVSQTTDLDAVNVTIDTRSVLQYDPVTKENAPTSEWTLNWILPMGKQGPTGIQGPIGPTGKEGKDGSVGARGLQGPWGKECNKC